MSQQDEASLEARVEALLFVSPGAVTVGQIANALEVTNWSVERALEALDKQSRARGIRIQKHSSGYQLTTAPELAEDIQRFLSLESTSRLTRAALEVMAIVAYQEVTTRPYIDSIRGVNSESALGTLVRHGLVEEVGRSEGPGRPFLYAMSPDFLHHFGLRSVDELPSIDPELLADFDEPSNNEEGSDNES